MTIKMQPYPNEKSPMKQCQVINKYPSVSNSGFLEPQIAHVAPLSASFMDSFKPKIVK